MNNNWFYDPYNGYDDDNRSCPCPDNDQMPDYNEQCIDLRDHGPMPYVVNIHEAADQNYNFRLALWTGNYLQLTLMNINAKDEIGLEMHPNVDQFLRIEEGQGFVLMGNNRNNLRYRRRIYPNYVIFVPAGTWHNIINTGCTPLKLYSIYAPPVHPHGTVHRTREEAEMEHGYY